MSGTFVKSVVILLAALVPLPAQVSPSYLVTTIAGVFPLGDGGPATAALLERPRAVTCDRQGNVFIADGGNSRIRKVTHAGVISTVAGYTGYAYDVKVDLSGNLYIADYTRVYRLSPDGVLTTVAGTGEWGYGGDDGSATQAKFWGIYGIAVDDTGNVYIADSNNHRVRKVGKDGIVRTIAGTGSGGFSGDNVQGTSARLYYPQSVAVDSSGNVYIADMWNYRIRKLSTDGVITTIAGNGNCCHSGDGGQAKNASVYPQALAADATGTVVFVGQDRARRVSTSGTIQTIAGTGQYGFAGDGALATAARLAGPTGVAVDYAGRVLIVDAANERVRRISEDGLISTVAGKSHFEGDGGPAVSAILHRPSAAAVAPDRTIYISDNANHRIRKVTTDGKISSHAGDGEPTYRGDGGSALSASLRFPSGMTMDAAGNLLVIDQSGYRVRRISTSGSIALVAGNGAYGSGADGAQATASPFGYIRGVATDDAGNLYLSESSNHKVRKVGPDGALSTLAGTGTTGFFGDGGLASSAQLNYPGALAADGRGNVYVYDSNNRRIRKITSSGIISTVAGNGQCCTSGDGGKAVDAAISVASMAVDGAGNLWLANSCNIRVVDTTGIIRSIAGPRNADCGFAGDGGPAGENTRFMSPQGIALAPDGSVIVVDTYNQRIRMLEPNPPSRLEVVSGHSQSATVGEALQAALIVRLVGRLGGGVAGVEVTFSVTAGEARLSTTKTSTDATGQAGISVTPLKAGALTVTATAAGFSAGFTFNVKDSAGPPPPAVDTPKISAGGIVQNGFSVPPIKEVSTGAVTSIYGENFAPAGSAYVSATLVDGKYPTKLAGVCVLVGGQPAPMFTVSPKQLTVQIPKVTPGGSVGVQVVRNCGEANEVKSNLENVSARAATPEFIYLRNNTDGRNPVAAQAPTGQWVGAPDAVPGLTLTPVRPGDVIVLYAWGLGATNPETVPGQPAATAAWVALPVTVSIGGVTVPSEDVLYVGVTPVYSGVYQVNLRVPAGVAAGNQSVVIQLGGASSPAGAYLGVAQ